MTLRFPFQGRERTAILNLIRFPLRGNIRLPYAGHKERIKSMRTVDYSKIGEKIKLYRSNKRLTQEKLGYEVATDSKHLSRIEQGDGRPSLELLIHLANALEVSADDILIDSLEHPSSSNEFHSFLLNCTEKEKKVVFKTLKFLEELFSELNI